MNLNELNTPFERHKIIHFAKDGNTVVHRWYDMQPVDGTLYKGRVEKDRWGEYYSLFAVFPGVEQGLVLVNALRTHNGYTSEQVKGWLYRNGMDSQEHFLEYLDSAEVEDRHINLAEIEFVRQFDAQRADRYAAYRIARYARLEEKRIEERKRREAEDAPFCSRMAAIISGTFSASSISIHSGFASGYPSAFRYRSARTRIFPKVCVSNLERRKRS